MNQSMSTNVILKEYDIQSFLHPTPKAGGAFKPYLTYAAALVVAAGIFYAFNAAAFLRATQAVAIESNPTIEQVTELPAYYLANTPVQSVAPSPQAQESSAAVLPENTLDFGAVSISAPIQWDTALATAEYMSKLQNGVIHIAGTPKPGQKGMSVIFGHSSQTPWAKGSYKNIFASLHSASVGQQFAIQYGGVTYRYEVTKQYEVQPHQMEVLNSSQDQSGVRLITCTPIGTALRRLVVEAKQISPDPTGNTAFSQTQFSGALPSDR